MASIPAGFQAAQVLNAPAGHAGAGWQVARLAALRSRRARRTRVGPAGRPTVPSRSVRVGSIGLERLPGHLRQQHVPGFGRHTASCRTGPRSGPALAAAAARRWRACGTWPRRRWAGSPSGWLAPGPGWGPGRPWPGGWKTGFPFPPGREGGKVKGRAGRPSHRPAKLAGLVLQVHGEHAHLVLLLFAARRRVLQRPGLCPRTCSAGRVGIGVEVGPMRCSRHGR